jgi:hypothetical protein
MVTLHLPILLSLPIAGTRHTEGLRAPPEALESNTHHAEQV